MDRTGSYYLVNISGKHTVHTTYNNKFQHHFKRQPTASMEVNFLKSIFCFSHIYKTTTGHNTSGCSGDISIDSFQVNIFICDAVILFFLIFKFKIDMLHVSYLRHDAI